MPHKFITIEKSGHIMTLTINRPEVMNAIHPPCALEMDAAFSEFQDNPDLWVCIVTGAGDKAFSAGNDLKFQAEHGADAIRQTRRILKGGFGGLHRRWGLYKPLIAAVNGFALGGGFELAMACDILIASETASFGLPEPRVGLMAGAGGVHRLPRQIPYHIAMGVILAGKRLSAAEAHRYGMVNEVVKLADLLPTAQKWAADMLEAAPLSIQASKEAAVLGLSLPLERAMDAAFPGTLAMYESQDFIEGPKAFAEKRKPNWKGN